MNAEAILALLGDLRTEIERLRQQLAQKDNAIAELQAQVPKPRTKKA